MWRHWRRLLKGVIGYRNSNLQDMQCFTMLEVLITLTYSCAALCAFPLSCENNNTIRKNNETIARGETSSILYEPYSVPWGYRFSCVQRSHMQVFNTVYHLCVQEFQASQTSVNILLVLAICIFMVHVYIFYIFLLHICSNDDCCCHTHKPGCTDQTD